jgi:hypothetical protein
MPIIYAFINFSVVMSISKERQSSTHAWGFHCGDYEECLLGHKIPVCTSQETHYGSATELSRLMLWKFWGLHSGVSEEFHLLRCDVVWLLLKPRFRRNVSSHHHGERFSELGTLAITDMYCQQERQGVTSQETAFLKQNALRRLIKWTKKPYNTHLISDGQISILVLIYEYVN